MMKRIYDWMMRMAAGKRAPHALAVVSFLESSIFPIPPDVMLVPMVLADRTKAWWYATLATITSVIGGIAGYLIGYTVFDAIKDFACSGAQGGAWVVLELIKGPLKPLCGEGYARAVSWFNEWGAWILIAKGWTPFPYKILTITAGALKMGIVPFITASIVARAMRFYLVAGLLYFYGPPIRDFIERRLSLVTTVFVVLLVGGFVALKYVF